MTNKQPPFPDDPTRSATPASDTRRRLLTGGVVAGAALPFLPRQWVKPVVEGVMLPAHAQMSPACNGSFSQTQGYDIEQNTFDNIPNQEFTYDLGGAEPCGDGTVTISNLFGDLTLSGEEWTIWLGPIGSGVNLGTTNNSIEDCASAPGSIFAVTLEQLENAIDSGSIVINAENGGLVEDFCSTNTMDVTLEFPILA